MVQLLVLHKVDSAQSGAAALILRLSTLWFGAVIGLITAAFFRKRIFAMRLYENDSKDQVTHLPLGVSE
jgi:uncharacterized membrane protein YbhN (UPF0104 family)